MYQFQGNKFLGNICPSRERDIRSQPGSFYIYTIQETRPFQLNFIPDPCYNNSYIFSVLPFQIFAFRNFEIIIHEKIASIFFFLIQCQGYGENFLDVIILYKNLG